MIELSLRRLRHHVTQAPGLSLAVLLCLALASALPATLAGHAAAVAAGELDRSLAQATPAERTLLVTGSAHTFQEAFYADLQRLLSPASGGGASTFFEDRLVIRHSALAADPKSPGQGAGRSQNAARVPGLERLDVYSFDTLAENVRLVEGRLPDPIRLGGAIGNWPPPMDAVIGARAAAQSGIQVGDRLTANNRYYRLDVVGIVEPLGPDRDLWGGDLRAFGGTGADHAGTNESALPLIIAPQSMRGYLGRPIFSQEVSWRITLDTRGIDEDAAGALRSALINIQTQSTARGATISTGLVRILSEALARLARARPAFLLVTVQTFLFVLFAVGVLAGLLAERARPELATLSARGASMWHIAAVWATQSLLPVLLAGLILGPALAWLSVYLWPGVSGMSPGTPGMWRLSGAVAAACWLILLVPVLLAARPSVSRPQPTFTRPRQASPLQRSYVDLYLLAFSGLLYWQLSQRGSFLMRQLDNTAAVDPLLLIGPTLLLVAAAIVSLRILPFLLRAMAWACGRLRGPALHLALLHPVGNPQRAGPLVLLAGLAAGMVLFSRMVGDALARNLDLLQPAAPVRGVVVTLQLHSLAIIVFSLAALVVTAVLAARTWRYEFRTLHAAGLSVRQWLHILFLERLVLVGVGLALGSLAGWSLAHITIPALSGSLAALPAGSAGEPVAAWPAVAWTCGVLLAVYASGLALAWLALRQSSTRWAQPRGDE
jgi:hypothetical protein